MLNRKPAIVFLAIVFSTILWSCSGDEPDSKTVSSELAAGVSIPAMDTSVKPGDDFNTYANGSWMATTEIPADRPSTSAFFVAFEVTEKYNAELMGEIIETKPEAGTDNARIADFYIAYVDTDDINSMGMQPIQADLARFAAISNKSELSTVLGANMRADVDPLNATDFTTENLFGVFVTQGLSTPGEVLPYLLQGGLGLPEREYYLSDNPRMVATRKTYRTYIENLLSIAEIDNASERAERIFALEVKIADAHATREDSEDFTKSAAIWSRGDFDSKAPGIDWQLFLEAADLSGQTRFSAYHANAISGLSALVDSEPLEAWKDWLIFHQINTHAAVLPKVVDDAWFAFYGTKLSGTPEQRSRDKRALAAVNNYLSDAVGRAYVERYFPAAAKADVSTMVDNIVDAFAERVEAIEWMAPETKAEALAKVDSIIVGVGYPENWRDYSDYLVDANDAYANLVAGEKAEYAHQIAKIGKPMDKGEWWMSPQVVNAVNLPVQNALNFPAGILQPPFFTAGADPAANYGAIGAVIGHEISHSFDNNGAAFDSTGALRNWWTDADLAQFNVQGQALIDQYNGYAPFPDLNVDGKLTLGENIADVAGLAASYDAYRASLNGVEAPIIDGLTGDQRFFLGYAQCWASKTRDEALRQRIATDGHAPGQYRMLTVRNLDAWYAAFDVQEGDALYLAPEDRVRIW